MIYYFLSNLRSEQVGPDWHHHLLWSLAFYCAEHFPDCSFRTSSVVDYVIHSALNGILDQCKISTDVQLQVLQVQCITNALGLEKLGVYIYISYQLSYSWSFKINVLTDLQGLERLCIMGQLRANLRKPVQKEIINIIRNIDRNYVFPSSLNTLLALVYTGQLNLCVYTIYVHASLLMSITNTELPYRYI